MRKILILLSLLGVFATGCSEEMLDDLKNFVDNIGGDSSAIIQNNEIWYTNGSATRATEPTDKNAFNVRVVSNRYSNRNNCWIIKFDGEVKSIAKNAFLECEGLTSVTIPDSVTIVEDCAFAGCQSLQEFKGKFASEDGRCLIVDGVVVAFAPAGLVEYTIPNQVMAIGRDAFVSCNSISKITMPDSVTAIGDGALSYCAALTTVNLSNSLSVIGDNAFAYCCSLSEITLPNSLKIIGNSAFHSCCGISSLDIPNGVTEIGRMAFCFSGLSHLEFPDSVTNIGENICEGCQQLKSVTLGNGITAIPDYAFFKCDNLAQVTLGDNVSTIGELAFKYCGLQRITLPESLTAISERAFRVCTCLKEVYCKATTPPMAVVNSDSWSAFDDNDIERFIYVPAQSETAYKSADGWSDYADAIVGYVYE